MGVLNMRSSMPPFPHCEISHPGIPTIRDDSALKWGIVGRNGRDWGAKWVSWGVLLGWCGIWMPWWTPASLAFEGCLGFADGVAVGFEVVWLVHGAFRVAWGAGGGGADGPRSRRQDWALIGHATSWMPACPRRSSVDVVLVWEGVLGGGILGGSRRASPLTFPIEHWHIERRGCPKRGRGSPARLMLRGPA